MDNRLPLYDSSGGMTLRDWFAGQALAGLLATADTGAWSAFARDAYLAADAMMAARAEAFNEK